MRLAAPYKRAALREGVWDDGLYVRISLSGSSQMLSPVWSLK